MTNNNLLSVRVSSFANYHSTIPVDVNLLEWLCDETRRPDIEYLRKLTNKEEVRGVKGKLPCITPSGSFLIRKEDGLLKHSGFICIDIDADDNPHISDFNNLRDQIANITNVAYCALSASGNGVFCLIPLQFPDKHKFHFEALKAAFQKLGVIIDKACGDVSRLRGYSYDPNAYINKDAIVYTQIHNYKEKVNHLPLSNSRKIEFNGQSNTMFRVKKVISNIENSGLDITEDYSDWFKIGCALANEFGEEGREMFHTISSNNNKYHESKADNQFDKCLENSYDFNIGTFFYIAGEYNQT